MQNPFVTGSSVNDQEFLGRNKEIRGIVSRLSNRGQSIAIVGEPRIGKTSLMSYLSSTQKREDFYDDLGKNMIFNYIDATTFGSAFTQTQFWWLALKPLSEKLPEINNPALTAAYQTCEREGFGVYVLEKLLAQLRLAGWRIILMLDEFDILLSHPVLNKAEFYGGLRSLDTRCESMALMIACRQSLESLNAATQEYSRMGSPYFNHMTPFSLGAFTEKEIHTLLSRGSEHFTKADKEYLTHIAGGHPFLIQAAAYALWEAYENGETKKNRWEVTGRELLEVVGPTLSDTWRLWSSETRQVVTIIALETLPQMISGRKFDVDSLVASLDTYMPEILELKKRGFLVENDESTSGYRLQGEVILWWLAIELSRITRSKDGDYLRQWQEDQQLDIQIKGREKSQLQKAFTNLGPILKNAGPVLEVLIEIATKRMMGL